MARKQRRRIWEDDEKRRIVAQTRVPGGSVSQVARRYDVNANMVFKWLRDPRFKPPEDELPSFLPVEVLPDASPGAAMADGGVEDSAVATNSAEAVPAYDATPDAPSVDNAGDDGDEAREDAPEEAGEDVGDDMADEFAAAGESAGDIGEDAGSEPEPPDSGAAPDAWELAYTIRAVLREELAGEMGQRMLQNVQRMIREEVAHAMLRVS